jgi:hypothetical protein
MSTSPTFVQGYLADITIGSADELKLTGRVLSMNLTRGSNPKPVFGQRWINKVPGQIDGTLSAGGHVSVEMLSELLPLIESDVALDFTIYVGEAGGAIDGGSFTGKVHSSGITLEADAEGEWEWSFDGAIDGAVSFTAPAAP